MSMIRKSLLQFIFSGSFMKRWNDKLRPLELLEVDKQAHKMITAWVLYHLNSRSMSEKDSVQLGREIVEGGIFEYLYRLVITDIKPPIFYKIKDNPLHYQQLTEWVLEQLEPRIHALGNNFWEKLVAYVQEPYGHSQARQILEASHLFASQWEFRLIKDLNSWDDEMMDIERNFQDSLRDYRELQGITMLSSDSCDHIRCFLDKCGQLRFQKRWSQTPRIPETSVLGHMFIVACYAYFLSLAVEASPLQAQNNFFAGLFHDLPELLTRDIISPVKHSVQRIGALIKEYEESEFSEKILGLLKSGGSMGLAERLLYFLGGQGGCEFDCTIRQGEKTFQVGREQLQETYNYDCYDGKDGHLLKVCDSLAAFIEAYTAMKNGITTDQLQQAVWRIRSDYNQVYLGKELHIGSLLADFD
ncbi:MAG TPA: HD domain-containing protein [Desulfohalobiaceae bacterium]|nr:HD domain-containing protein [Desulfohalobiaceae bacterium]